MLDENVAEPISLEYRQVGESVFAPPVLSSTPPPELRASELLLAVFVFREDGERWNPCASGIDEPPCTSIGFDVVDDGWISGLTNCGYSAEEKSSLVGRGVLGRINGFHLFSRFEFADEYRRECDTRVAEHAPFYVIELSICAGSVARWGAH